ncbi:MAG TPA: C2H2-type zinc finger protein [Bryobacteraceae bacterium]|nr:C2H2-type zinc finger protein [Bryobacteraceae bacterium]
MPTVGWILEGAVDRFWEGRPKKAPASPRTFVCPHCGQPFASSAELRDHHAGAHPLELPVLYVLGMPLLRETVLRSPIGIDGVEPVQCSRCEVQEDGGVWRGLALPALRRAFASARDATWNVRLIHERLPDGAHLEELYHIRFRIPNGPVLNEIDEHFIKTLARDQVTHSDLERYSAGLPESAPEREYGGALGDYALGVLLKGGQVPRRSEVPFEEFALKMRGALEVLDQFDRPVAMAVSGVIRFNLNDFQNHKIGSGPEVDTAIEMFRSFTGGGTTVIDRYEPSKYVAAVCPTDGVTDQLLRASRQIARGGSPSRSTTDRVSDLTRSATPISEQDLVKAHALCAESYMRLDDAEAALYHLRAIQFDPALRGWAQQRLTDLVSHER